jgi:hypothetical protein
MLWISLLSPSLTALVIGCRHQVTMLPSPPLTILATFFIGSSLL